MLYAQDSLGLLWRGVQVVEGIADMLLDDVLQQSAAGKGACHADCICHRCMNQCH